MTKDELKEYLKENLAINIELRGYDRDDIIVELLLEGETIDTAYVEGWHIRALQND